MQDSFDKHQPRRPVGEKERVVESNYVPLHPCEGSVPSHF